MVAQSTVQPETQAEVESQPHRRMLQAIVRFREAGIIIFILLLSALVTVRNPAFLSAGNLRDIVLNSSILIIVALAQMMVIITRGIDLSVGSMIGLTAMMTSFTVVAFPGMPIFLAIPLGMALGAVLGGLNGLIIAYGHVPPIIATLGTLSIYRGLIFLYSNGTWINAYEMPPTYKELAKGVPLGVPNLILIAAIVAVIVYFFLRFARTGRDIYAVGSNPDAARFAGITSQRIVLTVFL